MIPTLQLLFNLFTNLIEVGVLHALLCSETLLLLRRITRVYLMIVNEDVIKEIVQFNTN